MVVLGTYQPSLLGGGNPAVDAGTPVLRHWLDDTSWLDVASGWLQGADTLLADLAERLPWSCGRRRMYDRVVDDPRLSATCEVGTAGAPAILDTMATALAARYGERLDSVWVNYYRDGQDSVAWHSDRVGRTQRQPLVAIVTLGGPRRFLLRPRGGGRSQSFAPASGDLLVMGGDCQHRWEHTIPKAKAAQPRMSVTFRRKQRRGGETGASPSAAELTQSM
ncbi:MAG: alpha-ketoglutarate-dependent dioxygenase AlkB [Acidimicrobiia bacterium]|nr:alpha-ketoglutarate-dependent dioxygenase AlkB [Acidimicrobiia bacterium]MYC44225.1 alpha-ketoglutarate-dependent dioxygenase AlkB [Acidimicrobiia bacterium]